MMGEISGIRLAYEEYGRGNPLALLLIHGFPLDGRMWLGQVAALAEVAHVIVPDLRGHGRSEVPPGPYTMEQHADDMAALLEHVIGGLSMGGYGALYLGLRHADLFSAIGAHSPAILRPDQSPDWLYGPDQALFKERDIISLIARDGWPEDVRLWVDIGTSDRSLIRRVYDLLGELLNQSIPVFEAHLWPGGHDWDYWSRHAPDYLRFYMGAGPQP